MVDVVLDKLKVIKTEKLDILTLLGCKIKHSIKYPGH